MVSQNLKFFDGFRSPYQFNAKELDEETGNYYYGARYYNPQTSVWLSVDAMAAKYPSLSPYAFVANNPINLVDPDGNDIWRVKNGRLTVYKTDYNFNSFQNEDGVEILRTDQQVDWSGSKNGLIGDEMKDYKQIVRLINNDKEAQQMMKDRANETGWDDSQFGSVDEFINRMKEQGKSQKIADAIEVAKDVALTQAPGGIPGYDDAQIMEKGNELINNGETIPETMMRNGQETMNAIESFFSDVKSTINSTINNVENAVKNGNAPW